MKAWMNADETAECLHITKATLYKLVHERRVPGHRFQGRWMFRPEEIEKLFARDTGFTATAGVESGRGTLRPSG